MPAPSTSPSTKNSSMLREIARFRPCSSSGWVTAVAMAAPFTPSARVERVDLGRVLLRDRPALQLHGRRELVPAGQPVARHDVEALDLLDPGELGVGLVDALLHRSADALVGGQAGQVGVLDALALGPGGGEVG